MHRGHLAGAAVSLMVVIAGLSVCTSDGGGTAAGGRGVQRSTRRPHRPGRLHAVDDGVVDPRLTTLVTPSLLARALDELARSKEYGGMPVPSLLSHLPRNDGNGNYLAAEVRGGCDDSAPQRHPMGPLRVRVDSSGGQPRLVR